MGVTSGGKPGFVCEMYWPRACTRLGSVYRGASCPREETQFSSKSRSLAQAEQIRMTGSNDSGSVPQWGQDISSKNFHSGLITLASERAATAACVLCALAVLAFFTYHVLRLVHPESPFSFPKHPACLSRPIPSHHGAPPSLFVSGVWRTPTKLSVVVPPSPLPYF